MGAMTLDLEGWYKRDAQDEPHHIDIIHFHISEACHMMLEQVEEELQRTHQHERLLDVDLKDLEVETSPDCGPLEDCQLRVYLDPKEERAHFHLVGHRLGDHSLVYSNAVMVDMLM